MAGPSTITLNVETKADTAGLKQATAELREMDAASDKAAASSTRQSVAVVQQTTATANLATKGQAVLADATARVNTTTANTGQTMLTFGRILQDGVAAGLPGMVNNFEGLAMALGLGGGVAGAVTVLAVGLQVLLPLLGESEDKAEKAAQANDHAAGMARKHALEVGKEVEQLTKSAEAQKALAEAIERTNEAYNGQVAAAAAARKAREQEARLKQIEGDANADLGMAEIDEALSRNAITPEEAEKRRGEIARASEKRKFDTEQERKKAQEAEAIDKANALRQKEAERLRDAGLVKNKSEGLMTDAERKKAEEDLKRAEADSENERGKLDRDERTVDDFSNIFSTTSAEDAASARRSIPERKKRVEEATRRTRELRAQLERDKEAQGRSGFGDKGAADERAAQLRKEAEEAGREAGEISGGVKLSEGERAREGEAFKTRERAAEMRAETDRRRRAAEEEAARQKRAQDERREKDSADPAAEAGQSANALVTMGRGAGMNSEALTRMERLANQVAGGDGSDKVLSALDGMIAAFAKSAAGNAKMADKLAKMEKELAEANAALEAIRSGH